MMIVFEETYPQASPEDIENIESITHLALPEEYKRHILRYNGGCCSPSVFEFVENGNTTSSTIHYFLAFCESNDSLIEYVKDYKIEEKRLPYHVLPIAYDPFGNLVCISCGSEDYGKVYFWDHENEVDYTVSDDSDYSNLYLIAGSFDEFLASLKDED